MSSQIIAVFSNYQKSRVAFAQQVADLSTRPQNIEFLRKGGALNLLKPLLSDTVPSIQQTAAMAIGRLASYNEELAQAVVAADILPQLVLSLAEQSRYFKKSSAFVIRHVAKHSLELTQAVIDAGALPALGTCLEDFDNGVKEASAWALGYVASHSLESAQAVVDAGAIPLLLLCVHEPELALKRIAVSALGDICKHGAEHAQAVVDANSIPVICPLMTHNDSKIRRHAALMLAQVVKHSVDLAEIVLDSDVVSKTMLCLQDDDLTVKRNNSALLREICKHNVELARLVVNAGGVTALVDVILNTVEPGKEQAVSLLAKESTRLPAVMALGYIGAFSETLALTIISSKGVDAMKYVLLAGNSSTSNDESKRGDKPLSEAEQLLNEAPEEKVDHFKAAAAWSVGQIGKHTTEHSRAVAELDILRILLELYRNETNEEDLRLKAKQSLKSILSKCTHLDALTGLMREAPVKVLKIILAQLAKVLPHDKDGKKNFIQSGCLQFVQELEASSDELGEICDEIEAINGCFPKPIVDYYSPKHADKLLELIEAQDPRTEGKKGEA